MKLTEKELNEFPVGTKIYCGKDTIIKADFDAQNWRNMVKREWYSGNTLKGCEIGKVEIPKYTEYIPPKPILDEKEKEYLSAVIYPFREKIKSIRKKCYKKDEYIYIYCERFCDNFGLPYFKKGTMYKGMELDREYSLEELDI